MRPKDKIFDMEWRPENTTKEEIAEGTITGNEVSHSKAECVDELFNLSSLGVRSPQLASSSQRSDGETQRAIPTEGAQSELS